MKSPRHQCRSDVQRILAEIERERVVVCNFIAACIIAIILVLTMTGCAAHPAQETRRAIPRAIDRDAHGRYLTPHCPVCGAHPAHLWTAWRCAHGHEFATADINITPR